MLSYVIIYYHILPYIIIYYHILSYIKHLLDKAMADIEIYSGEQSNIRRGQRPSWILS